MRCCILALCVIPLSSVVGCSDRQGTDGDGNQSHQRTEAEALAEAKAALESAGSPNDVLEPHLGLTRLHVAARDGHVQVLSFLIERGGDVNIRFLPREKGPSPCVSPLHYAYTPEIVDLLLDKGADINIRGATGESPLGDLAYRNRRAALVRLVERGADVNARDELLGQPVLVFAVLGFGHDDRRQNLQQERLAIIEYLVSKGAEINARSQRSGKTALHLAAMWSPEATRLLLRLGADPRVKDNEGKTPLDTVGWDGDQESAELLRSAMGNVD